nr:MAG TPA: tail completion protein [Caudoviricetes sp.]DAM71093.1 MAG TPA: tail completion protein [Caudoviricetes sp.]
MTVFDIYKELEDFLHPILDEMYFESPDGKRVKINIYKQSLPPKRDDEDITPIPYLTIKVLGGTFPKDYRSDTAKIRVILLIGIMNTEEGYTASRDVLGVMERIRQELLKVGHLKTFSLCADIDFTMNEEDEYPYSFGGMDLKFRSIDVVREDEYT